MLYLVVFGLVYTGCAAAFYAYLLAEARPMPGMPDIRNIRFNAPPKRGARRHHAA